MGGDMKFLFSLFLMGTLALPVFSSTNYDAAVESFKKTLSGMVAVDTSNPPGNESRIVKLVAKRLKAEKLAYDIVDFAPGRQCIVTRLKGEGNEKPLLLLAHLDVVGTQKQNWSSAPHQVTEKEGF